MPAPTTFDDVPVLGKMKPEQVAAKLRAMGDARTANALEDILRERAPVAFGAKGWWPFGQNPPLYMHTTYSFGFIAPAAPGSGVLPIRNAGNIEPDAKLKDARVKITLNRLRAADYPGTGMHNILFDFYAQNQVAANAIEDVHFNAVYRVQEGEHAPIVGYPIFIGLKVGSEGVAFKCFTVNVKNENDELFLSVLESDVFKAGLQLASVVQPAIKPLSQIAVGMATAIGKRNQNAKVQEFYLGLDFTQTPGGARLAEGAYVAVQIPENLSTVWDWNEWVYHPDIGHVVSKDDQKQMIPYNYIVFGVSRYEGA